MSHEPAQNRTDSKSEADPSPDRKPISAAKLAANRANALLSTGPRTPPGKAASRKNSTKHGHCALVVDIPDEDPKLFDSRFAQWNKELNPAGEDHAAFVVSMLVRHSQNLDRLATSRAARLAKLARDAVNDLRRRRAEGVEQALRTMDEDPDIAVRQLRETPEGCEALIREWEYLKAALHQPAHWDGDDAERAQRLLGNFAVHRMQAPSVLLVPTEWIEEHRLVAHRISENRWPDRCAYEIRYATDIGRNKDLWMIDTLAEASRLGTNWLATVIEAHQQELRERIATLDEEDVLDIEQATLRARVDLSDEGRLLHRYELEHQRGFFKTLGALKAERADQRKQAQERMIEGVTEEAEEDDAPTAEPVPARNEPKPAARTYRRGPIQGVEIGGKMIVETLPAKPEFPPYQE